jgi:hypothetical protein
MLVRPRLAAGALAFAVGAAIAAVATPAHADVVPPPNRIRANGSVLYDSVTGTEFKPRGANYVRLATQPGGNAYHSVFEPGRYQPGEVEGMLASLQRDGYNTVRVFIDSGDADVGHGLAAGAVVNGLNQQYLDNVRDFVARAIPHHIYVLPTMDLFPVNQYYRGIVARTNGGRDPVADGVNRYYMDRGHVVAKRAFMQAFTDAMSARLGPYRTGILAYQTDNEAFWDTSARPFDRLSGRFTVIDGPTREMSLFPERRKAAQESMRVYVNNAVAGVHGVDPDALVTIGFGTNFIFGRGGFDGFRKYCQRIPDNDTCGSEKLYRHPGEPADIANNSAIDFVDVHIYPRYSGYSVATDLLSSEVQWAQKPFILGELGADSRSYPSLGAAAVDMQRRQVESCGFGNGAKGWLFFTFDTDIVNPGIEFMELFYSLQSPRYQGTINGRLAPVVRPNPCA